LHTYSAERRAVAKQLIDFDREWAAMLSAPFEEVAPAEVQNYFVQHRRYTAGTATRYEPSILTGEPAYQHLAKGLTIGMRFHSAPVVRLADAKAVQFGHVARADGRWRIYAFSDAENPASPSSRLRALGDFLLDDPASPVRKYTPAEADIDSVIDVLAVLQQSRHDLDLETMPAFLLPRKGRHGLRDYEKLFCPNLKGGQKSDNDIFDLRGIDREKGCMVVVRPDQYVAHVLPLDAGAELAAFFDGFMLPQG
jgi:phenol 2-monooxygenase